MLTIQARTPIGEKSFTQIRSLSRWERYRRMMDLINSGESVLAELRTENLDLSNVQTNLALSLEHAESDYRTRLVQKRNQIAQRLRCYLHDPLPSHQKKAHRALCTLMCIYILPYAITWRTAIATARSS
jgi:hypothetical protein